MKAMARTSSMTKLVSNHDNMKSQPVWSQAMLTQLESIPQDNNISSTHSAKSSFSESKSQQNNQWRESGLAAGMMAEEKEQKQEEIATITPTSSEEEETSSPSSLSPSSSFNYGKETVTTDLKTNAKETSSSKGPNAVISKNKARTQTRHKTQKGTIDDDEDAQSVASNISRLRAKQKLLRLHSANKLAESRRRLSLQQQPTYGQQYLSYRDASSVTSRTTISEWSTLHHHHHAPVHRRSSIPRQVLINESSQNFNDLRQSAVHELNKDTLTVTTESERVLQERLSKVQDELAGTRQMIKFVFVAFVLTAMGLIFRDEFLQVIQQHSRFGSTQQAPLVPLGQQQMQSSVVVDMDIKSISTLVVEEISCNHEGNSSENTLLDSGSIVLSSAEAERHGSNDEFPGTSKSKANKKAILDRAQRILKSKRKEFSLDTRNPDYIGLLLSQ